MATGVSVKMGVTGVKEFKKGIADAEASIKAMDQALKLNEAQLKLNGDAEIAFKNKVQILKDQIVQQTEIVRKAQQALQTMKEKGVDTSSKSFQDMQRTVYTATTKLLDMKTNLKEVEENGAGAAKGLEKVDSQVDQIAKNTSWANVARGIKEIRERLESAGRAAISFGKKLMGSVQGSAEWADNLMTTANMFEISPEQLQRMQKVADFIDTDVDAILTAQQRMKKATTTKNGKEAIENTLGIDLSGQTPDELFWEIGDALMHMSDEFDKESAAQSIFGRSWRELMPLFKKGQTEYQKMLDEQTVLSDEQVEKLGNVDDMFKTIEQEIQQMKNEFWANNADKIMELMQWLIDHKDAIVVALTAIAGGLAAMRIAEFAANLQKVVQGFQGLGLGGGGAGGAGAGAGAGMGGTGAAAAGKGTGFLGTLGRVAPFAAPAAVLIDSIIRGQQQINEDLQRGAAATAEIGAKEQLFAGNPMYDSWKTLTDYMHVTGGPEDTQKAQEFAKHYLEWFNDDVQDRMLDELSKNMTYEEFDSFDEAMKDLANGTKHYSEAEIEAYNAPILRAIEVMEQMMGGGQAGLTDTVDGLKGVPGQMVTAVQKGVSGIRVTLDGYAVGRLVAPYVSQEIARAVN